MWKCDINKEQGVNENRFSSKDIHIINGLVDEITTCIIVDDIRILYVINFVRFVWVLVEILDYIPWND